MIGEMASLLSHELNQPLAAIAGYATGSLNLLKDSAPIDPVRGAAFSAPGLPGEAAKGLSRDLQLAMGRIAEQAERAGKVIKSVHDFVRRRDQAKETVEPRALLDAVMPLVSLQAHKLSVAVTIDVDPACGPVLCDRTMVEQVLLNLSRNGMQAMAEEAALHVEGSRALTLRVRPAPADEREGWVEFSVIDQGVGISAAVAAQLFTPFFTTKVEGMGLGLSLCRTVIEQHGGSLGFHAGQPRGTIFTFTLPHAVAVKPR